MTDTGLHGTRIFKKSALNGKITIYLAKRDFYDHLTHVDPIEGVVLLNPTYIKTRKVYASLLGTLRFGRNDQDLVDGADCKEFYVSTKHVYPPNSACSNELELRSKRVESQQHSLTRLQERLMRKLGSNAYPFYFQIPAGSPASVTICRFNSDQSKSLCVEYYLKIYVADGPYDKPQKRNSVRMTIRKLSCAPELSGPQPSTEITKEFLMSAGNLRVEASLDKEKYHLGETICVNVLVDNSSNKTVKRIKLSVQQHVKVNCTVPVDYKSTVAEIQSEVGFPIPPCQTSWCKVYRLCPSLLGSKTRFGVAVDGDSKHEHTDLASSTIVTPQRDSAFNLPDICVKYVVKIRLTIGFGVSDVCLQLPFVLAHPDPKTKEEEEELRASSVELHSLSVSRTEQRSLNRIPLLSEANGDNHKLPLGGSAPAFWKSPCAVGTNNGITEHPTPNTLSPHANALSLYTSMSSNEPPVRHPSLVPTGSSVSNPNHFSGPDAQSAVSVDDLLFEDFARFRLQASRSTNDSSQTSTAVFSL